MKKVILAYSGGLDTTCCLKWLKDQGYEVVCFSADLGGEISPADLRKRAIKSGASKIYIKDLRKEFAYGYILPALEANLVYEDKYVLSTALGRPLIAKHLVELAKKEKAKFVSHGSTGKGNDQLRFELTTQVLGPNLKTIVPLRVWDLTSRESEISYAKKNKLPLKTTKEKIYSVDKNIWGTSVEGGVLEEPEKEPPLNSYYSVQPLKKVPNKEISLSIEFHKGTPVKLNGKKMDLVSLIEKLNKIGAKAGIGRTDLIEDRVVGIKSREIYEAPGAWILLGAHKELESLVLDGEIRQFKQLVAYKYAQLVYQGLWFTNLREALTNFVNSTQKRVTGKISLKLYKGNITVAKRISKYSIYKQELATYGKKDSFDRSWAEGFINIWSAPYKK